LVIRFRGRSGAGSVPAHGLAPQNLSSDKHVDVCVDSDEDRGSTPLASRPKAYGAVTPQPWPGRTQSAVRTAARNTKQTRPLPDAGITKLMTLVRLLAVRQHEISANWHCELAIRAH